MNSPSETSNNSADDRPEGTAAASGAAIPGKGRRGLKLAAAAFFTFHAAAILMILFASDSALYRTLDSPFRVYRLLTGNEQHWNLFLSIPSDTGMQGEIRAYWGEDVRRFHMILPGLTNPGNHPRYRKLTYVMLLRWPERRDEFLAPYLERACREIEARTGRRPDAVELDVTANALLRLEQVRETGRLGMPVTVGSYRHECAKP